MIICNFLYEPPLAQIKNNKMFKIFKPYMLLLLILLASSSIAMAQDCLYDSDCRGSVCVAGECVTDVTLDRDLDGVPDAVDDCPNL